LNQVSDSLRESWASLILKITINEMDWGIAGESPTSLNQWWFFSD